MGTRGDYIGDRGENPIEEFEGEMREFALEYGATWDELDPSTQQRIRDLRPELEIKWIDDYDFKQRAQFAEIFSDLNYHGTKKYFVQKVAKGDESYNRAITASDLGFYYTVICKAAEQLHNKVQRTKERRAHLV